MRPRPRRRLALIVLLAAAAIAVLAFPVRDTWWGGWILAIAEAGVVGGLADWFAVTAIFRHPLGVPIPHTALIPANWELMARRVGTMVGDRVLTKDYVASEIARLDLAGLLARAAEQVTREDIEAVTATIVRGAAAEVPTGVPGELVARLRAMLREWPAAPMLAAAVELARQHGWDQRLVAALARGLGDALERPVFRAAIEAAVDEVVGRYRERMIGYPRILFGLADAFGLVDRRRIVAAIQAGVREVAEDPEHPLRRRFDELADELPDRLRTDAALIERVEAVKVELVDSAWTDRLLDEAAAEIRRLVADDLAAARPEIVRWIADRLERARRTLLADPDLRGDIDRRVKAQVIDWVGRYHDRIATFIENGVRALGPEGAVHLIEEHAGDDLQFIRINGTIVGGLAGAAIYGVHLIVRNL